MSLERKKDNEGDKTGRKKKEERVMLMLVPQGSEEKEAGKGESNDLAFHTVEFQSTVASHFLALCLLDRYKKYREVAW